MSENKDSIPYSARCPENIIPPRGRPGNYKTETGCWELPKTEIQENYMPPRRRKQIVTRESRFEQFLWHQFYQEYLKQMQKKSEIHEEEKTSEYLDKFGQIKIPEHSEEEMQDLIEKYPIYASGVISFYNPEGRRKGVFNRAMNISRPTALQFDSQFG